MQLRAPLQIQSMIKAMTDVVLPAVDPHNKLAQEQARLVIGMLGLMSKQLPLQYRFDCDELARLIEFSADLQGSANGGAETQTAVAALGKAMAAAKHAADSKPSPDDAAQQVRTLRRLTGDVISSVFHDGDPQSQAQVRIAVLKMSKEQLLRDRSWVLSQGWESDPAAVPAIESLLASSAQEVAHR